MKTQKISLIALLIAFWLLNSGHYTPLILGLGAASIVLVFVTVTRMKVVDEESLPFHLARELPSYYIWLIGELIKSNLQVVRRIWSSSAELNPAMETIEITQHSDMGRVILANSISLTPGTMTTAVTDNSITVHALDKSSIDELKGGEFGARIRRLTD
ncbi:MAG: Na+/H+ antiporter subunit E [Pseudohongiellaceae bacterium]|nr:Na+/H+ antiporter subunit E [Pseudohongiellaceae bacterium]